MPRFPRYVALGAAVALAVTLAGCTGGAPSADDSDPNVIRFMIGQPEDPADLELTKQDMAKFEEETGIRVELDVIPSENVRTIVQTQLRSGDGPDVFGYDTGPGCCTRSPTRTPSTTGPSTTSRRSVSPSTARSSGSRTTSRRSVSSTTARSSTTWDSRSPSRSTT